MTKEEKINFMQKSIISGVTGVVVALFSFYLARKAYGEDAFKKELDQKLDKVEFIDYKTDLAKMLDLYDAKLYRELDFIKQGQKETNNLIIELIKNSEK